MIPVNEFEHLLEDLEQTSGTLNLEARFLGRCGAEKLLHLLDELVEDVYVHDAEDDQEGGGHRGTDDAADLAERAESVADGRGGGGGGDGDGRDDHDAMMTVRIFDGTFEEMEEMSGNHSPILTGR